MTKIVVVGYPKSGTTWVTRLVAELVGCPVAGFWKSDQDEIAQEGQLRESNFECYKSHHQLHELGVDVSKDDCKVIYVVRDPRDIVLSGSHFFKRERYPKIAEFFARIPKVKVFYSRILGPILNSRGYRMQQMTEAVLYGSDRIHYWTRIPWREHYRPYLEKGFFFVKYENLIEDAEQECIRILSHIGVEKSAIDIRNAIDRQSFEFRKKRFIESGQIEKATFMRVGQREQWRYEMSKEQKDLFAKMLSIEFCELSYPKI